MLMLARSLLIVLGAGLVLELLNGISYRLY